jgi:hypothetical protein
MPDLPEDWVLIEGANRGGYHWKDHSIRQLREAYIEGFDDDLYRALCDMILKHEQPPVDRKLLCAREAAWPFGFAKDSMGVDACVRAIELYESGFGN